MKTIHVRVCIEALKGLRDDKRQELSTSIIEELDAVIVYLQSCCERSDGEVEVSVEQRNKALELLGQVFSVATNLTALIRKFFE